MVLPSIEKTPILLARFTKRAPKDLISLVRQRLADEGLVTKVHPDDKSILTITTTQENLEREAERIHLLKRKYQSNVMEYFTVATKMQFCDPNRLEYRDQFGLFTAAEWVLLVRRMADRVEVLKENQSSSELSRILDQFHIEYNLHLEEDKSIREVSSSRRDMLLREQGAHSACLRYVLQTYDLIDTLTPVHIPVMQQKIFKRTLWPWYQICPNVHEITHYYGWEIGFYFGWMQLFTKALIFPAILGLIVYLYRIYRNDTLDEDEFTPFYGLITFVWAIFLLRFWERQENILAYEWGTFSLSAYERQKYFAPRPEFRGYLRVSPVSGEPEVYYPAVRRRLKYIVSTLVTVAMLGVAFTIMIISLNAQGYIRPSTNPSRWNDSTPHPFHVKFAAQLSAPGAVCDSSSWWRALIPVVVHAISINLLNGLYRQVAEKLTEWENHETEMTHNSSLVLKRFLFEAFDCYIALFYLAFYERDVEKLRLELVAIFQIDTVRRVLLESVLPLVLHRLSHKHESNRAKVTKEVQIPTDDEVFDTLELDTFESFDDMMEIVIQVGYVTLFASAYPLASLLAIFANWIEVRSDSFKLATVCRRPFTFRQSGLGMWNTLLSCVIWMSALTNCLIAGFTSDQLMHYLPSFYVRDESGFTVMGHDKSWLVVFVIFGLEHVLIAIGLLIYALVPALPESIQEELERRQYLRMRTASNDKKRD